MGENLLPSFRIRVRNNWIGSLIVEKIEVNEPEGAQIFDGLRSINPAEPKWSSFTSPHVRVAPTETWFDDRPVLLVPRVAVTKFTCTVTCRLKSAADRVIARRLHVVINPPRPLRVIQSAGRRIDVG